MKWSTLGAMALAAMKSAWTGGSPFAVQTVLYPPNEDKKYIIQAEGIRLAFALHGGALSNLWINDTNGIERDIVLGYDHADDYLSYKGNPFLNGVIGRYAGMIRGASFKMRDMQYDVSANANGGKDSYNGGEKGWGRRTLDVASHSENSITFVVFDREWNGFPGRPAACITHTVLPYEWQIGIGFVAVKTPSPVSMSQQVFWNLDGLLPGSSRTIMEHKLKLPYSGLRFDLGSDGVPTGDLKGNVKDSAYDFWSEHKSLGGSLKLGSASENGSTKGRNVLDQTFMIMRSQPWKSEDGPVAVLSSPVSGIKVELFTDQEALRVATWNSDEANVTDAIDVVNLKRGQGSGQVQHLAAISMEMQNWPDAISHPEWQRGKETIFGTDRIYSGLSSFRFSVDRAQDR